MNPFFPEKRLGSWIFFSQWNLFDDRNNLLFDFPNGKGVYRRCKFDLKYLISFSWMLHITFHYTIYQFFILQKYLLQLRPTINLVIMVLGCLLFSSKECSKIEGSSLDYRLLKWNQHLRRLIFFRSCIIFIKLEIIVSSLFQ